MSRRDRWARRKARDAKLWMTGEDLTRRVPRRVIARPSGDRDGEPDDEEPDGGYRRPASTDA